MFLIIQPATYLAQSCAEVVVGIVALDASTNYS